MDHLLSIYKTIFDQEQADEAWVFGSFLSKFCSYHHPVANKKSLLIGEIFLSKVDTLRKNTD